MGALRTHAIKMTGTWNQHLRPLSDATKAPYLRRVFILNFIESFIKKT